MPIRRRHSRVLTVLLGIATIARYAAAAAPATEPSPSPVQLPDAVRATVTQHLPDGKITGFEHHVEDRRHLFFVDVKRANGDDVTLLASGRGQYLGLVEEDEDEDDVFIEQATAPAAVKAAVAKYFGKPEVDCLFMEVDGERFIYCAEQTTGKKTRWASFTLQGGLTEEEEEVAVADLPAAVKDAVAKAHPTGKIESASLVKPREPEKPHYSMDVIERGKTWTLTATPEGRIDSNEAADEDIAGSTTKPG